jgi:hypothetical protein
LAPSENTSVFDFGEFSPRSLGVTLNLPEDLGPHLLNMASFLLADDPEEIRYLFLRDLLRNNHDPSTQFMIVSCGSALSHELKHFHDYLSSPFGCLVIREHLLLILQFLSVTPYLLPEPVIGIPLQQWRDLSDVRHKMYARSSQPRTFSKFPSAATEITECADGIISKIQSWHGRPPFMPGFPITARHLIEAAAIEVQVSKISQSFGPEHGSSFRAYLRSRDDAGTYTAVSDLWQKVTDAFGGAPVSAAIQSALLFYSLCGKPAADPTDHGAHPVSRFLLLAGCIRDRTGVPAETEVLAFLDDCAAKYVWPTLSESLQESSWANHQYGLAMREIVRSLEGNNEANFPELIFTAYDAWVAAHEQMVSTIINNPMAYFDPSQYLLNVESWVAAPIYVSTTSPNLFIEGRPLPEALRKRGWEPVWWAGDEEHRSWRMIYGPELTPGVPILSKEHAEALSCPIWVCYALWSRGMLNPVARSLAGRMLESLRSEHSSLEPRVVLHL